MPPSTSQAQKTSLSGAHAAWAAGHALVLFGTLWNLFKIVTFSTPSKAIYSISFGGAILSWFIVIYKAFGVPAPNMGYIRRILMDENGQYLALAAFWFWNKPIYVALLPFATFSLFHTLGFIRSTFLPPVPSKKAGAAAQPAQADALTNFSKTLQSWVKKNYEPAMTFVGYTEVVLVLPYIALGALLFRNSFIMPLAYAAFLRLRYQVSAPTRKAFADVDKQLVGGIVNHPSIPPIVKNGVKAARDAVARYGSAARAPAANQPRAQ